MLESVPINISERAQFNAKQSEILTKRMKAEAYLPTYTQYWSFWRREMYTVRRPNDRRPPMSSCTEIR